MFNFFLLTFVITSLSTMFAIGMNDQSSPGSFNQLKKQIQSIISSNPDSAYALLMEAKKQLATNKEPDKKLYVYKNLGKYFNKKNQLDSAERYLRKGITLAERIDNKSSRHDQMAELAFVYNKQNRNDTAISLYEKAIKYYRSINDTIALGSTLSSEGSALMGAGLDRKALEAFYEAERYLKHTDIKLNLGAVYENIASINGDLGYDSISIQYYKKAISLYKKLEDSSYLAQAYSNAGVSFKKTNQYDSALYYYNRARELAEKLNLTTIRAQTHSNTGNILDKKGKVEEAMQHYQKSLQLSREINFPPGVYYNNINISEIHIRKKNYQKAIQLLNTALPIGKKYNLPDLHLVYKNLYEAHKKTGPPSLALKYHEKMAELRDSIHKAEKHKELMELQAKYDSQQKEADILKLKKEKKQEELEKAYLLAGMGGIIVITLVIVLWSRNKSTKAKQKALQLDKENQKKSDQMEKLRLEHQLEKEASDKYQLDLQFKEQELVYQTLKQAELANKNKAICEKMTPFKHRLSRKKDQEQFEKELNEITNDTSREPLSDFEQMFLQMHGNFYEKLLQVSPDLSRSELEMCSLLRMNLPSKEIANVLNLSISTIDQRRHSIRKKLNLENQQNLISYLIAL